MTTIFDLDPPLGSSPIDFETTQNMRPALNFRLTASGHATDLDWDTSQLFLRMTIVPEASTGPMIALGLAAVAAAGRRRSASGATQLDTPNAR